MVLIVLVGTITVICLYRKGYGYAKSEDGKWEVYDIPAFMDYCFPGKVILIYNGNDSGNIGNIEAYIHEVDIEEYKKNRDLWEDEYSVEPTKRRWKDLIFGMEVYSKSYYYFLSELLLTDQTNYPIYIVWEEDNVKRETELKVNYDYRWKYIIHGAGDE